MSMLSDHWSQLARQWSAIGSPLRPDAEDLMQIEHTLTSWRIVARRNAPRVLLLGVTPEIVALPWPEKSHFVAVDRSLAMIRAVWPGAPSEHCSSSVVCGSWSALPLAPSGCDIVLGDGCYTLLRYPDDYIGLAASVCRVLAPQGLYSMRFFLRPEITEPLAQVFDDLWQRRIGNFHIFKWRLAMALHGALQEGVRLADVWQVWHDTVPDAEGLARYLDWPIQAVHTINAYRDASARYTFPTLAEARAALAKDFEEIHCYVPTYELGQRCPTLRMRLKP